MYNIYGQKDSGAEFDCSVLLHKVNAKERHFGVNVVHRCLQKEVICSKRLLLGALASEAAELLTRGHSSACWIARFRSHDSLAESS
jgi:hypothetical protein